MKNPSVEFAGYTVPHPSEPIMNVRVQCHEGTTTDSAMLESLGNLSQVCDHVLKTYRKLRRCSPLRLAQGRRGRRGRRGSVKAHARERDGALGAAAPMQTD
ncbi:unnamed protein product [Prorocentrum cordatum]|uniref:DNA-directed RNA polymerase RBP11-like dimerisation domain-containing protein n=1 Tax=Prorocentrum cordatum TaxID=2364126 RepID=A0ABN9SSA4_9DINO|nr:unnamed protein product [Polarella glacialis]